MIGIINLLVPNKSKFMFDLRTIILSLLFFTSTLALSKCCVHFILLYVHVDV